jgi:hypothetical protein
VGSPAGLRPGPAAAHRAHAAKEALGRFECVVQLFPLAGLALEDLTLHDMLDWRESLQNGTRQPRSVNRYVSAVAAGLTRAVQKLGFTGDRAVWQLQKISDDVEESGESAVYLDHD